MSADDSTALLQELALPDSSLQKTLQVCISQYPVFNMIQLVPMVVYRVSVQLQNATNYLDNF